MNQRLMVINLVGLVPGLAGPRLQKLIDSSWTRPLAPPLPAVTCTSQASMLTGKSPRDHGIVGNGWYFRDLSEICFWRQSNRLVQGNKVWETLRESLPSLKVANMFWWFNMYSTADFSVTPRPEYPADGRKIPGVYTQPYGLRSDLESRFGPFPLFHFWGPGTDIRSTRWIVDASEHVLINEHPDLMLVYLPHMDYVLQREGPDGPSVPAHVLDVDEQVGRLLDVAENEKMEVLVVSEYGIGPVQNVVYPNRALREAGLLKALWQESVGETLDAGASRAFAVCDHQMAHLYVNNPEDIPLVREIFDGMPGVGRVFGQKEKRSVGLDHPRSGELVLESSAESWFAYPYWLDEARVPDFARTVDIHRKPGYDPAELFFDPALRFVKARVARKVLARKMGFRNLLDVISTDPSLVRGSHGREPESDSLRPLALGTSGLEEPEDGIHPMHHVHDWIADYFMGGEAK